MAHLSNVDFQLHVHRLPWLPGAVRYGEAGAFPAGMGNNLDYFSPWVTFASEVGQVIQDMLWTPETSGGLLVAVPADDAATYLSYCDSAVHVGEVLEGDGHIEVLP
jgi:selenide,water dikinase